MARAEHGMKRAYGMAGLVAAGMVATGLVATGASAQTPAGSPSPGAVPAQTPETARAARRAPETDAAPLLPAPMVRTAEALRDRAAAGDSPAWTLLEGLTTEIGPRPAGSDAMHRASDWAVARMTALGFANVHKERFTHDVWTRGGRDGGGGRALSAEAGGDRARRLRGHAARRGGGGGGGVPLLRRAPGGARGIAGRQDRRGHPAHAARRLRRRLPHPRPGAERGGAARRGGLPPALARDGRPALAAHGRDDLPARRAAHPGRRPDGGGRPSSWTAWCSAAAPCACT